ncbi:acyl-CoA N-acyltransferase [Immersiella caudata]|uniref:Acyl-CoA N-acyltransferase n=1 Tax=Immersiella caudata TaxID=314043 RepID=A0AA39WYK9_9PEZI|nr:acyl-CoA N-acyltransferase [Immersiella caudata]
MYQNYNFCFPIQCLEDTRIKLVPFEMSAHAQRAYGHTSTDPLAFAHTANGPYESVDHFVSGLIQLLADDEYAFTFAIIDKSRAPSVESAEGEMVGIISFSNATPEDFAVEISFVQIFAEYRGRGIATAAARLLLQYAFRPQVEGGLGLHRVEWHASTANTASIAVAEKLGFERIGTVRYERVLVDGVAKGKVGNGKPLPPRCKPCDLCRDLVMYAAYWDSEYVAETLGLFSRERREVGKDLRSMKA